MMPTVISHKATKEDAKALSFLRAFVSSFVPLCETVFYAFLSLILMTSVASAQKKPVDPNKFVLIINGPGGEVAYDQQFEEWTTQLRSALSEKFGFDGKSIRVLSRASAEQVRKTFTELKSQLDANNVLFVFLIGHGSFDGKEAKFNLVGPDLSASEYNVLLSSLPTRRVVVFRVARLQYAQPVTDCNAGCDNEKSLGKQR